MRSMDRQVKQKFQIQLLLNIIFPIIIISNIDQERLSENGLSAFLLSLSWFPSKTQIFLK